MLLEGGAFLALAGQVAEEEEIAVVGLNLGVGQIDTHVHHAPTEATPRAVEEGGGHEGHDDDHEQEAENGAVVLRGGGLQPGNHPSTLGSPEAAVNQSKSPLACREEICF